MYFSRSQNHQEKPKTMQAYKQQGVFLLSAVFIPYLLPLMPVHLLYIYSGKKAHLSNSQNDLNKPNIITDQLLWSEGSFEQTSLQRQWSVASVPLSKIWSLLPAKAGSLCLMWSFPHWGNLHQPKAEQHPIFFSGSTSQVTTSHSVVRQWW